MKIWFDRTPVSQPAMSECDNDCTDPNHYRRTSEKSVHNKLLFTEEDIRYAQANTFQHSISLHTQSCSEDRWLVCNSIEAGRVAVLDSQAFTLLERFHTPTALSDVLDVSE